MLIAVICVGKHFRVLKLFSYIFIVAYLGAFVIVLFIPKSICTSVMAARVLSVLYWPNFCNALTTRCVSVVVRADKRLRAACEPPWHTYHH